MVRWKRKIFAFCMALCLIALATGCSVGEESGQAKGTVSLDTVCESLMQELEYPEMADVSNRYEFYYSLADGIIEECRLYVCSSGAYPDELAVFRLENPSDFDQLKSAVDLRKTYLLETWKDYKPEEVPKIENAVFLEYAGNYFYVISENQGKTSEILSYYFG